MKLLELVSIIIFLSIATESLVEIFKGLMPWLYLKKSNFKKEGKRIALIRILAVFSGILTAFLSKDIFPEFISSLSFLVIGLTVSSFSSLWHGVLAYSRESTNLKKIESTLVESANLLDFSQAEEFIKNIGDNRLKAMDKLESFNNNIKTEIKELQKNLK